MDNGQFQIPINEQAPSTELIQELESSFDARDVQEMNEMAPYEDVEKVIEQKIDMYRAHATEANLPKVSAVDLARAAVRRVQRYL